MEWPVQVNVGEVRSFVSTCSYYRRYVAGFATIAAPLRQLTKHGDPFVWNAERQQAFDTLKSALSSAPILAMPRDEGQYGRVKSVVKTTAGSVTSRGTPRCTFMQ